MLYMYCSCASYFFLRFLSSFAAHDYSGHLLAGVYSPLTAADEYPCEVSTVPGQDLRRVGNGIVFTKGWDLTDAFNYHFLKVGIVLYSTVESRFFLAMLLVLCTMNSPLVKMAILHCTG